MKNQLALVCRTCAAGAVALFLSANASAGVVFRGAIDPQFGLGFTGLSYTGEVFFDVDQACLDENGEHSRIDTCGQISMLSATVTLAQGLSTQTLTFFPDPPTVPVDPILDYFVEGNTLFAVETDIFGPQIANLGYSGPLWLELFGTFDGETVTGGAAQMYTGQCQTFETGDGTFTTCVRDPNSTTDVGTVTITQVTQVPEPGTVALLIGAMAAGWTVRRRRSSGR